MKKKGARKEKKKKRRKKKGGARSCTGQKEVPVDNKNTKAQKNTPEAQSEATHKPDKRLEKERKQRTRARGKERREEQEMCGEVELKYAAVPMGPPHGSFSPGLAARVSHRLFLTIPASFVAERRAQKHGGMEWDLRAKTQVVEKTPPLC